MMPLTQAEHLKHLPHQPPPYTIWCSGQLEWSLVSFWYHNVTCVVIGTLLHIKRNGKVHLNIDSRSFWCGNVLDQDHTLQKCPLWISPQICGKSAAKSHVTCTFCCKLSPHFISATLTVVKSATEWACCGPENSQRADISVRRISATHGLDL